MLLSYLFSFPIAVLAQTEVHVFTEEISLKLGAL